MSDEEQPAWAMAIEQRLTAKLAKSHQAIIDELDRLEKAIAAKLEAFRTDVTKERRR